MDLWWLLLLLRECEWNEVNSHFTCFPWYVVDPYPPSTTMGLTRDCNDRIHSYPGFEGFCQLTCKNAVAVVTVAIAQGVGMADCECSGDV